MLTPEKIVSSAGKRNLRYIFKTFLIESEQNHCCDKTKKVLVVEKINKDIDKQK